MDKIIRKAARCYLLNDKKILVTKYKKGNRIGFYDTPGGKIEEGETSAQAAIRETKEETGLDVKNLKYKGNMIVEYPNRIFDFDIFVGSDYEGQLQEFEENTVEWIEIPELLQKEKILSNLIILESFLIKSLIDDTYNLEMYIEVDEEENVLEIKYKLNKI